MTIRNTLKISVLFLAIFATQHLAAQLSTGGKWLGWETIYSDNYITVQLNYFEPDITSCNTNGRDFKYKYQVKGRFRNFPYYLSWKMNYIDCNGNLYYRTHNLEIGSTNPPDITNWIELEDPLDYRFPAASIEKTYYEPETGNSQKSGTGMIARPNSEDPDRIEAHKIVYFGQNADLRVKGGSLGIGAKWVWYKDNCGGTVVGRGEKISISPQNKTKYFVRAEGKNNITNCVSIEVDVDRSSLAPNKIVGRENVCNGESTELRVEGGHLGPGAQWVWYAGNCTGKHLGAGASIKVSPSATTQYFVRAEGPYNKTTCQSFQVNVASRSLTPASIRLSESSICEGKTVSLTVIGGQLSAEATWEWYTNNCGSGSLGSGPTLTVQPGITTNYFVRGEGVCNNTACISTTINVTPKARYPGRIIVPSTVFKGKKTELLAEQPSLPPGIEYRWYSGDCAGNFVGKGPKVTVRPRSNTRYFLQTVGKCNESNCSYVDIQPVKTHSWSNNYANRRKFLGFGWGLGIEYLNLIDEVEVVTPYYSRENSRIDGIGVQGELVFYPLIINFISLGFLGSAATGTTPFIISEDKNNSYKYFYYRFTYGAEFAFGFSGIKALGIQNRILQFNDYNFEENVGASNSKKSVYNRDLIRETLGLGLRFGRYLKDYSKGGFNFDLLYTWTQDVPNRISSFDYNQLTQSLQGVSLGFWKHNRFKFKIDIILQNDENLQPSFSEPPTFLISWLFFNRNRYY